ncbi:MAG: AI-2E family transporter [Candidatus Kapaibacterium sp.]
MSEENQHINRSAESDTSNSSASSERVGGEPYLSPSPTLGLRGMLREDLRPQERFAIIGGFGLLGLQLYTIVGSGPIHPIFPTAALIFFLYPFSRGVLTRRLMQLGLLTFGFWMFASLIGVLFPFIVAFVFSYLCAPLVQKLAERGIPRWITSLSVALLIVGVYSLIGFLLIPAFIDQFDQLLSLINTIVEGADEILRSERMVSFLTSYGVSKSQAEMIVAEYIQPQMSSVANGLFHWLTDFLQNVTGILAGLANLILIPFLSYYMTVDFNRFRRFTRTTLLRDDPRYVYYLRNVDKIVNAYIRGIFLTSSLVGTLAVGVLTIFGVPYALVLGVLTGLFNLIPTLGMFLNLGVAIVIFLLVHGDFLYNTAVMSGTILGLHALNTNMIEPRVLGARVGVHPVLIIASLFIFAYFMGFVGLLIAVPTTAVVLMFLKEWYSSTLTPTAVSPEQYASIFERQKAE